MREFCEYQKKISQAQEVARSGREFKDRKLNDSWRGLFNAKASKFERLTAFLSIVQNFLPADSSQYATDNLPFHPADYEFNGMVGGGGENDVYELSAKKENIPSWAMKINRLYGGDVKELTAKAKEINSEYKEVKSWFQDMPGLVPEEYNMIMEDPRDKKPAIVTLQKYYGQEIRDLFKELEGGGAERIFKDNPQLKDEIFNFIRISEGRLRENGDIIDLIGPKNLSVIDINGQDHLVVLDPHLISNPRRQQESVKKEQNDRLDSLRELSGYGRQPADDLAAA